MSINKKNEAIFLIHTKDRKGILAEVSNFFSKNNFNVIKSQTYSDLIDGQYFMRIRIDLSDMQITCKKFEADFAELAKKLDLSYTIHYTTNVQKMAILVSKTSHCLYDLLMHHSEGELDCEIPLIISNHPDLEVVADRFRIPYYCFPVNSSNKAEQEALEASPHFGGAYYIERTSGAEEAEKEAPKAALTVVEVNDIDEAREYLMNSYGYSGSSLRSKKAILDAAQEKNIEFKGI
jgi:predicted amino acid-binding ACT domain protein